MRPRIVAASLQPSHEPTISLLLLRLRRSWSSCSPPFLRTRPSTSAMLVLCATYSKPLWRIKPLASLPAEIFPPLLCHGWTRPTSEPKSSLRSRSFVPHLNVFRSIVALAERSISGMESTRLQKPNVPCARRPLTQNLDTPRSPDRRPVDARGSVHTPACAALPPLHRPNAKFRSPAREGVSEGVMKGSVLIFDTSIPALVGLISADSGRRDCGVPAHSCVRRYVRR